MPGRRHRCALVPQDELPYNDFFEYYGPDYRLHITPSNMENKNGRKYLEDTKVTHPRGPPCVVTARDVGCCSGHTSAGLHRCGCLSS